MVLGACWSRHPLQAAAPAAPSEARLGKVVARSLRDCVSWGGAAQLSPRAGAGAAADTRSGRRTEVAASQAPFFYVFPPALASVLPKKKIKKKNQINLPKQEGSWVEILGRRSPTCFNAGALRDVAAPAAAAEGARLLPALQHSGVVPINASQEGKRTDVGPSSTLGNI